MVLFIFYIVFFIQEVFTNDLNADLKEFLCDIDQSQEMFNKTSKRGTTNSTSTERMSLDDYIHGNTSKLFNCTEKCSPVVFNSSLELYAPNLLLKSCVTNKIGNNECTAINYRYLNNSEKLLFLKKTIPKNVYFIFSCKVGVNNTEECRGKKNDTSNDELTAHANQTSCNETSAIKEYVCEDDPSHQITEFRRKNNEQEIGKQAQINIHGNMEHVGKTILREFAQDKHVSQHSKICDKNGKCSVSYMYHIPDPRLNFPKRVHI